MPECLNRFLYLKPYEQNERRNIMNDIILTAAVSVILIGLLIQGVRVLFYARSDAWKVEERLRRFVRLDAE
jgi:NhaP-type Na+/H+ or K+/H+ antiporter